jgi:hypothetical protein
MTAFAEVEHVRWNAYMRAEGYRYSQDRNDLARVHNNLVPVSKLSIDEMKKDVSAEKGTESIEDYINLIKQNDYDKFLKDKLEYKQSS